MLPKNLVIWVKYLYLCVINSQQQLLNMSFTFKRVTGRWDRQETIRIKSKRVWCGYIVGPRYTTKDFVEVRFKVIKMDINSDGNPNCKWQWVKLGTPEFQNIDDAKKWCNDNYDKILKLKLNLSDE